MKFIWLKMIFLGTPQVKSTKFIKTYYELTSSFSSMSAYQRSCHKKWSKKTRTFLEVYLDSSYILLGHNAICLWDWLLIIIYLHVVIHVHLFLILFLCNNAPTTKTCGSIFGGFFFPFFSFFSFFFFDFRTECSTAKYKIKLNLIWSAYCQRTEIMIASR